jgi:hypothetical protein
MQIYADEFSENQEDTHQLSLMKKKTYPRKC